MNKRTLAQILGWILVLILTACTDTRLAPTPTGTPRPIVTPSTPEPTAAVTNTPEPTVTSTSPLTPTRPAAPTETTAPAVQPTRIIAPPGSIQLPDGFGISVFAEGLSDPRMMALGPDGFIYVAERGRGRIVRLPDRDGDGVADGIEVVADGLSAPSSIAFYQDGSLYVGETRQVLRLNNPNTEGVFQERQVIVDDLPAGGGHSTRTVLFSPDWQWLYVSVGSSCNVCVEQDSRRAAILRYTPEGEDETIYVSGMRNAVGITFRPGTDELWATNNGRDWLGDDLPPETVYKVRQGDNAGWPYCHAGQIIDPDFGQLDSCTGILKPEVEIQAHSAPLGLTFYTGEQFPPEYRGNLIVALHGSWNRSAPVGYKVVRVTMDNGIPGKVIDLATGWLPENGGQWGRPVDVLTGPEGSLFVSDDGQGRIYRIFAAAQ